MNRNVRTILIFVVCFAIGFFGSKIYRHYKNADMEQNLPTIEQMFAALDANDDAKLLEYAKAFGFTEESFPIFKDKIAEVKEQEEHRKEREAKLGTWQNARENGLLLKTETDKDGYISEFYDVTGDGVADFQIVFYKNKPYGWRYLNENGEPDG